MVERIPKQQFSFSLSLASPVPTDRPTGTGEMFERKRVALLLPFGPLRQKYKTTPEKLSAQFLNEIPSVRNVISIMPTKKRLFLSFHHVVSIYFILLFFLFSKRKKERENFQI